MSSDVRYPVRGLRSTIECPVHGCAVAVGADGRLSSTCPRCVKDANTAIQRLHDFHNQAQRQLDDAAPTGKAGALEVA